MVTFLGLMPIALLLWMSHAARRWKGLVPVLLLVLAGISMTMLAMGGLILLGSQSPAATFRFNNQVVEREVLAAVGRALTGGSLAALLVILPFVQRLLARVTAIRPQDPVHTTALVLACYAVTLTLVQVPLLDILLAGDVSLPPSELVGQALGLVVIALAGVGLGVTRSLSETVARLGLAWPGKSELTAAATGTVVLLGVQAGLGAVWMALAPESLARVNEITNTLLGDLLNPWGAFLIGLSAGLGEEMVFRGALQPRFGLVLTSALFAFVHLQYVYTFAWVIVFLLGLGLGYLRQRWNTTTAILAHMLYNTLLVLMAVSLPNMGP